VVAVGETVTDPEGPDAKKPVPLQVVALALLHISVEDRPLGTERAEAERAAVGAGAVAACATPIAEALVGCEGAPTFWGGTSGPISCSAGACVEAGISVTFNEMWERAADSTISPEVNSVIIGRPSFIVVYTVFRNFLT